MKQSFFFHFQQSHALWWLTWSEDLWQDLSFCLMFLLGVTEFNKFRSAISSSGHDYCRAWRDFFSRLFGNLPRERDDSTGAFLSDSVSLFCSIECDARSWWIHLVRQRDTWSGLCATLAGRFLQNVTLTNGFRCNYESRRRRHRMLFPVKKLARN